MQKDRRNAAEADEDGGGGDEKYEIKALRKTVGSGGKVATMSQHTGQYFLRRTIGSYNKKL